MKAIFISYNKALTERVELILDHKSARGYTRWENTQGRGMFDGEPHMGTHTWPAMNSSVLTIVEDQKVGPIMDALRELDGETKMQGLRAFVWSVEEML